jgi:hypothetical protein
MSATMASPPSVQDDPLVSALPPATDYMTYLTLLEYQLTPQNLGTLNRLLSEDDGKLAEEIGWDLLRLILPMLEDNPQEATHCLELVARRGNPREVVVRVAEELEKLGDQAEGIEEGDFDDDQDELPTFPGEAPRVHLGQMTLEGMPDAAKPVEPPVQEIGQSSTAPQGSAKSLQFQGLLNMLGILHPRIKTQFPSRFLATSLPAALGAYRQIPTTTEMTAAFLNMLEKLAGNKRPALPPRASTRGDAPSTGTAAAPLPDPEAKAEVRDTGANVPSAAENAIVFRLLDAVLLEILDEYLASLASHEFPSMSWTSRLRELLEPKRIVPGRPAEIEQWKQEPELSQRDALLARFFSVSKGMQLDTSQEIRKLIHEDGDEASENPYHEEEQSEYPTSPSQIPFPRAGVIYLHAYHSYLDPSDTNTLLTTTELTKLIAHSFPLSATPAIPLPALQDALLSLLYKQALAVAAAPTTPQPSPAKFVLLLSTLTQLFTITPYPALRDSAHYIATKLLHAYPDPSVRIRVTTQSLEGSTLSSNWAEIEDEEISMQQPPEPEIVEETGLTRSTSALVPHPIPLAPPQQLGQLKAIAVNWLKEEFMAWIAAGPLKGTEDAPVAIVGALDPTEILIKAASSETAEPAQKDDKPSIPDLLFPLDLPSLLSSTSSSTKTPEEATVNTDALPDFLLSLPFYISTLNLLCILLPAQQPDSPLTPRVSKHIDNLTSSSRFLLELLHHAQSTAGTGLKGDGEEEYGAGVLAESRADIFALEDACTRATAARGKLGME